MMNLTEQRLNDIQENGLNMQPFSVLKEAFLLYKKTVFSAASSLMLIGFSLSFLISFIFMQIFGEQSIEQMESLAAFDINNLSLDHSAYYLLALTVFSAISSVLTAGFIQMNANIYLGVRNNLLTSFSYLFSKKGAYVFIAQFCISIVFSSITFVLNRFGLDLVALAITLIINAVLILATPLIIFGNLSPFRAISKSIMVVNHQPLAVIFLILINYILLGTALVVLMGIGFGPLLIIGIFFLVPFIFSTYFALYNQTIGFYGPNNEFGPDHPSQTHD